jgi:hypothetical protein
MLVYSRSATAATEHGQGSAVENQPVNGGPIRIDAGIVFEFVGSGVVGRAEAIRGLVDNINDARVSFNPQPALVYLRP